MYNITGPTSPRSPPQGLCYMLCHKEMVEAKAKSGKKKVASAK